MKKGNNVKDKEIKVGRIKEVKIAFEGLDECITIKRKEGSKANKVRKKRKSKDACKVCEKSLYLNEEFTKRVAISEDGAVVGWLCPFCKTEFTLKDEIVQLMTNEPLGEA